MRFEDWVLKKKERKRLVAVLWHAAAGTGDASPEQRRQLEREGEPGLGSTPSVGFSEVNLSLFPLYSDQRSTSKP